MAIFKKKEDYQQAVSDSLDNPRPEHIDVVKANEELDTKLEAHEATSPEGDFKYAYDKIAYEWEKDNPMAVPKDILEKYPGLAFRFRAIDPATGHLRKGDQYRGWQVFKDNKLGYEEGLKYGGDTVLCAMPEERAQSYRDFVANQSTEAVKGVQRSHLEAMNRAARELEDAGAEITDEVGGVKIGARRFLDRRTGKVMEQYRGYHPDELREMAAQQREDRKKRRTYSYPGQSKRD